jgi:4-hydroxy-4-methyl-2-oxoglutarate aldolase
VGSDDATLVAKSRLLDTYSAADIYDANERVDSLDPAIKPLFRGMRLVGPAFTVRCAPGDNLAIHRGLAAAAPGYVLAIGTSGGQCHSYLGAMICEAAKARGVQGILLDGLVRDLDAIGTLGFPVFARGAAHVGATKVNAGDLGIAVVIGNVTILPGDVLVGDGDGVVRVAQERMNVVLERGPSIKARDSQIRAALADGFTTLDFFAQEERERYD